MVCTDELSDRPAVTCIQIVTQNNTRSKFQADHTELFEHVVINGTGRKQAKQIQQSKLRMECR